MDYSNIVKITFVIPTLTTSLNFDYFICIWKIIS